MRSRGLDKEYDLTLETTHHGPVLTKPTLYIEIGSTEKQWNSKEAADAWASVIAQNLGLKESEPVSWREGGDVMIGLGGGHYRRDTRRFCQERKSMGRPSIG